MVEISVDELETRSRAPSRPGETVDEYVERVARGRGVAEARTAAVRELFQRSLYAREFVPTAEQRATVERFYEDITRAVDAEDGAPASERAHDEGPPGTRVDGQATASSVPDTESSPDPRETPSQVDDGRVTAEPPRRARRSTAVRVGLRTAMRHASVRDAVSLTMRRGVGRVTGAVAAVTAAVHGGVASAVDSRASAVSRRALRPLSTAFGMLVQTTFDAVALVTLLVSGAYVYYVGLGTHRIVAWDEGIYANIARNMLEGGHWVVPMLNWWKGTPELSPFLEKPPGMMWLQAASMSVFGTTNFAARFPAATAAILGGVLAYVIGRRLYDRRTGYVAGLVWITAPYVSWGFNGGRQGGTDVVFLFWGTVFVFALWRVLEWDEERYWPVVSLSLVAAFLTKGLAAGVFLVAVSPLVVFHGRSLLTRQFARWGALTAALLAAWPLFAWLSYGDVFLNDFLLEEVINRVTETRNHPDALFGFMKHPYLTRLPMYFDPWAYLWVPASVVVLADAIRAGPGRARRANLFLVWWPLSILGFFVVTGDHGWYILPMYLPAGVLVGRLVSLTVVGRTGALVATLVGALLTAAFSPRLGLTAIARSQFVRDGVPGCCNLGTPGAHVAVVTGTYVAAVFALCLVVVVELSLLRRQPGQRWLPAFPEWLPTPRGSLPAPPGWLASARRRFPSLPRLAARERLHRLLYRSHLRYRVSTAAVRVVALVGPLALGLLVVTAMAAPTPGGQPQRFEAGAVVGEQVPETATIYVVRDGLPPMVEFIPFDFYAQRTVARATVEDLDRNPDIAYAMLTREMASELERDHSVVVAFAPPHYPDVEVLVIEFRSP